MLYLYLRQRPAGGWGRDQGFGSDNGKAAGAFAVGSVWLNALYVLGD